MAVISISRQVGSGGHEIAQLLSKKLGYRLFDRELIGKIGAEAGLTKGDVVDLTAEKHHSGGFAENRLLNILSLNPLDFKAYEASGAGAEDRSAELVSKIMLVAYEQGDIVLEGRGSQGVLRDHPDVLQVRVMAPVEQRIEFIKKRDNVSSETARKRVKEADVSQADYMRHYFDVEINDPTLYHLIINTGKVSVEAAVDLILKAMENLPAKS